MTEGIVFNVQRFSTDDGDGIRTCVFLKGCPLRCAWCHNAEGLSSLQELAFYGRSCIGCGTCVSVCPKGAITLRDGKAEIDRSRCTACGACADGCPASALVRIGKRMTVDEVMERVRRDRIFYGKKGGLTVTGGEPMAQAEFTIALAKAANDEGISVFVESSGFGRASDFLALLPYCHTFLFDCKASSASHKRWTGVEDGVILQNLDLLCQNGARVRLRCPVIVGANGEDEWIEKIVTLAKRYDAIESVQLMPYHKTGIHKSQTLGGEEQTVFASPDEKTLLDLVKKIKEGSQKETFF